MIWFISLPLKCLNFGSASSVSLTNFCISFQHINLNSTYIWMLYCENLIKKTHPYSGCIPARKRPLCFENRIFPDCPIVWASLTLSWISWIWLLGHVGMVPAWVLSRAPSLSIPWDAGSSWLNHFGGHWHVLIARLRLPNWWLRTFGSKFAMAIFNWLFKLAIAFVLGFSSTNFS